MKIVKLEDTPKLEDLKNKSRILQAEKVTLTNDIKNIEGDIVVNRNLINKELETLIKPILEKDPNAIIQVSTKKQYDLFVYQGKRIFDHGNGRVEVNGINRNFSKLEDAIYHIDSLNYNYQEA